MKNKRIFFILAIIVILLLIPFIAMQITDSVNWSLSDFVVMSLLLSGTGLLCEFTLRKVKTTKNRIIICLIIILIFILIWAELAVGIFGSPIAGS